MTSNPNIVWVHFDELDFSKGAPVKKIDLVEQPDRIGNISSEFKEAEPFEWAKPEEKEQNIGFKNSRNSFEELVKFTRSSSNRLTA